MKKSLFIAFGACLIALGVFTAFSDSMSPEQKEEQQKIEDLLTEKLDVFRIEKEQECMDRAMEVAVVRADSMMTASATKTVRKKPKYTTKGTKTTTTPPPPKTTGDKARDKMRKNTGESKTTTAPAPTKEELKETATKAKDKMRKKKGGK